MTKGEPILIERVVNGWIVNPKEVDSFTKSEKDLHIFESIEGLKTFIDQHFNKEEKK